MKIGGDYMRMIDADALMEVFANLIPWCIDTQEELAFTNGLSSAYEATKNAPTIEAEPLVRCKDCKHFRTFRTSSDGEEIRACVGKGIVDLNYDDFCSKGERKDDE